MENEKEQEPKQQEPEPKPAKVAAVSEARGAPRERRSSQSEEPFRPRRRGRRRVCPYCEGKLAAADYKDFNFLRRFISDRGRIESRRKSGTCAKHQRAVARAVKRARYLALLPYTADHIRESGVSLPR